MKILEVCLVAPPQQQDLSLLDSDLSKSLPLTFFDLLWLRVPPVERLYFYQISSPNTQVTLPLLFDTIIPKLKHSLSLTLFHFLPLVGNLIWPQDSHKPIIKYVDGDGVSLTIAESNIDFYHLCSSDFREAKECRPLIPQLAVSHDRAEVMALQVTVFPNCGGFCIGITTHHAVMDGRTSTSFMKSWAHVCKDGAADHHSLSLVPELMPFYNRAVIKDPAGVEAIYVNEWLNHGGPNNKSLMTWDSQVAPGTVRGTFELSRANIEKLRKSVCPADDSSSKRPSTFSLTCGYTWVCLEKARVVTSGERAIFGFSIDARSRLKPTIHPTYFGNCIAGRHVVAETEELAGENGIRLAVEAISEAIRGLEDGVLNGAEAWASMITNSEKNVRLTGVAGSPRFEVYSTDFGWGRPMKVELTNLDKMPGAISMSDTKNGNGGVEIGLVLNMQEMESFDSLFAKGLEAL